MSQNLSSAAVVIGSLRVRMVQCIYIYIYHSRNLEFPYYDIFQSLMSVILANSEVPDEKSHSAPFIWVFTVYHYTHLQHKQS